jgi:hypothetical protein
MPVHGVIVGEGTLWKRLPARELQPTAAYRRGVDSGEWSGAEKFSAGWEESSGVESTMPGEARGDKW